MRKSPALFGVVPFTRTLLFSIARHHRRVQIQIALRDVRKAQHLAREVTRLSTPCFTFFLRIILIPETRQRSGRFGKTRDAKSPFENLHAMTPPLHVPKTFAARKNRQHMRQDLAVDPTRIVRRFPDRQRLLDPRSKLNASNTLPTNVAIPAHALTGLFVNATKT